MPNFSSVGNILLLAFGFGFVIFWHEMGHFLAAKWADVKVEQFAVGFGQALLSWRKGLGFRWGSTQDDYQDRLAKHIEQTQGDQLQVKEQISPAPTEAQLSYAAKELGISETEYRLNWIPLGGYVKMLGQDDLKPGQVVSDPRSYNNKSIGQRMVIVSAGVIMNVILAAFGFMYIFTVGFKVPKPVVGMVLPGSPAQLAYKIDKDGKHIPTPLRTGDEIMYLNGKWQSDFEKIHLNTALLIAGDPVTIDVKHADGNSEELVVVPSKPDAETQFPLIGIGQSTTLQAAPDDGKPTKVGEQLKDADQIQPGDTITQINGKDVDPNDCVTLFKAIQTAAGKPVDVTVKNAAGKPRSEALTPQFVPRFDGDPISFAGLQMLSQIDSVLPGSPALGKLHPGDIVLSVRDAGPSGDQKFMPSVKGLVDFISQAGAKKTNLTLNILRDGKQLSVDVAPTMRLSADHYGLGIGPGMAEQNTMIAEVTKGSPADLAGIPAGAKLISINGSPIHNWFDVNNAVKTLKPEVAVDVVASVDGQNKTFALKPTDKDIELSKQNVLQSYTAMAMLEPAVWTRKASSPLEAAKWGIGETRDAILQVYQTVRSMVKGSISSKEISGPIGILGAGYKVAELGTTRLIWFLSIISANLAVMNFLPIPIVDGGLFTFLIIEKIKGSPISPRIQAAAQVAGLAILLSVFLFATYQDVFNRLPFLLR